MTVEEAKVQVCLDFTAIDDALKVGKIAVEAGVDWIEVGTPLIVFNGLDAVNAVAGAFPEHPVVADLKALDGVAKYVREAARRGASFATVVAVAADAAIRQGIEAAKAEGVRLVGDLYATKDPVQRALELEVMGVDSLLIHAGTDTMSEHPDLDPLQHVREVAEQVSIPVGVVTFTVEQGVRAVRDGASFVLCGHPLIDSGYVAVQLSRFVTAVKQAGTRRQAT